MSSPALLQDDVLREIFTRTAEIDPPSWQSTSTDIHQPPVFSLGWIVATHVCSHWRMVGIDMATLWSAIVCALPNTAAVDVMLARSKSCPLHISISLEDSWERKLSIALQHLERVESLKCVPSYDWHRAFNANRPLPFLRHLEVNHLYNPTVERSSTNGTLTLITPQLHTVVLENASSFCALPTESFHRLSSLTLEGLYAFPNPAWEIYLLLQSTPQLQYLSLQILLQHHPDGGRWNDFPGQPVVLANLETAVIYGGPHVDVAGFWRQIHAPQDLDLYMSIRGDSPLRILTALDRQIGCPSHNTITIMLGLRARHLSISTFTATPIKRSRVMLDGGTGATLSMLGDLPSYAQLTRIDRFNIEINVHALPELSDSLQLFAFARRCPNVKTLSFQTDNPDHFFNLAPGAGKDSLFPALRTLSVRFDLWGPDSDSTYRRWWDTLSRTLEEMSTCGRPLHVLRLAGQWAWTGAGIKAIDEKALAALKESGSVENVIDERAW